MTFKISKGYPPDEEWPIAEVIEEVEGEYNAPAIVRIEDSERRLAIFDRTGQVAWNYPLDGFVEALQQAESSLADYPS